MDLPLFLVAAVVLIWLFGLFKFLKSKIILLDDYGQSILRRFSIKRKHEYL